MSGPPKKPDPLRERISALPSLPLPTAKPVREDTVTDGMLGPSPGSTAPYRRSNSPPPAELAPTPESVRIAREAAKAAAAAQDAVEAEQRRALKPSTWDQLSGWLGTARGKAAVALVGVIAGGGTWEQVREPVLAAIGIASTSELRAVEDRQAKRVTDAETKLVDQSARLGELEKRLDRLKTTTFEQGNDIADLKRATPKIVGTQPTK